MKMSMKASTDMENEYTYYMWFDRHELEVDDSGAVVNKEKLYIAEYDEDGNFVRRVDYAWRGKVIEVPMDISVEEMESFDEYVVADSVRDLYEKFYRYLDEYYIEVETSPQTYWQPAEYIIVGLR